MSLSNRVLNRFCELIRSRGLHHAVEEYKEIVKAELLVYLAAMLNFSRKKEADVDLLSEFVKLLQQRETASVLEVGGRDIGGNVYRDKIPQSISYTSMDIHAGPGVNVVGDAHNLRSVFSASSFDGVFSVAVFEHLAMPWKVIMEVNHVLKMDGLLLICTHGFWPPHELPWDFWRYTPGSFRALLNRKTGFEIISILENGASRIVPLSERKNRRFVTREECPMIISVLARKIDNVDPQLRWDVDMNEVTSSQYPEKSFTK